MSELLTSEKRKALDKHDSNKKWYTDNYEAIKQIHKGKIVVIFDENKVESYDDINMVRDRLRGNDVDTQTIIIDYISDSNAPLVI